jgi:molybdopterin-guanine dinucleotide biosynthesis protein A
MMLFAKDLKGVTGVVLAGGENRRFPTVKSFISIDGATIIERQLSILRDLFDEVFISTNTPELYFHLGAPLIGDVLLSNGPMSGIFSALINAEGDNVFTVACDMPFIRKDMAAFVCMKHLESSCGRIAGATIPLFDGKPQPLFGVYHKMILPRLEEGVLNGKTSLRRFLSEIDACFIDEQEVRKREPEGTSFVNINTMQDYEAVMREGQRVRI